MMKLLVDCDVPIGESLYRQLKDQIRVIDPVLSETEPPPPRIGGVYCRLCFIPLDSRAPIDVCEGCQGDVNPAEGSETLEIGPWGP